MQVGSFDDPTFDQFLTLVGEENGALFEKLHDNTYVQECPALTEGGTIFRSDSLAGAIAHIVTSVHPDGQSLYMSRPKFAL